MYIPLRVTNRKENENNIKIDIKSTNSGNTTKMKSAISNTVIAEQQKYAKYGQKEFSLVTRKFDEAELNVSSQNQILVPEVDLPIVGLLIAFDKKITENEALSRTYLTQGSPTEIDACRLFTLMTKSEWNAVNQVLYNIEKSSAEINYSTEVSL